MRARAGLPWQVGRRGGRVGARDMEGTRRGHCHRYCHRHQRRTSTGMAGRPGRECGLVQRWPSRQTTVRFIDDLDGSEASGTFDLSLDGRDYQIDLSDDNAAKLRDALSPFVNAARKAGVRSSGRGLGRGQSQPAAEKPARTNRQETHAIREWAREHGHEVNDRGRIPKSVMEAYQAAN